jgi:hypothetical protein
MLYTAERERLLSVHRCIKIHVEIFVSINKSELARE